MNRSSAKIRSISLIRAPILLSILLDTSCLLAQPKNQIKISLTTSTKYELKIKSLNTDSASVRITNQKGHTVKKLTADDFLIIRDGDTATINSCIETTTAPTNELAITFILDNSASMFHSYDSLTKYLDKFIDSLGDGFIANAMTFDNVERKRSYDGTERESLFIASSEFTQSRSELKNFWHSYDSIRTDLTPLYSAIISGLTRISDRRKIGDSLRSEIVIVVTDGEDNGSSIGIEKLFALASVMPVTIFTVNFRSDMDGRLSWLAKKTQGNYYMSEDLVELQKKLNEVRKNISSSYTLKYSFPLRGPNSGR